MENKRIIPRHVAIIMDGNRRYAKEMLDAPASEGHTLGKQKLREALHWCLDLKITHLTVYAFSIENFQRESEEVEFIMGLLEQALYEFAEDQEVHDNRVAIRMIGNHDLLPDYVNKAISYAENRT